MKLSEEKKILIILGWIPTLVVGLFKLILYFPYIMIGKINTMTNELNSNE